MDSPLHAQYNGESLEEEIDESYNHLLNFWGTQVGSLFHYLQCEVHNNY